MGILSVRFRATSECVGVLVLFGYGLVAGTRLFSASVKASMSVT